MINMMLFNPENPVILSIYRQGDHFRTHAERTPDRNVEPAVPGGLFPITKGEHHAHSFMPNIMHHSGTRVQQVYWRSCNRLVTGGMRVENVVCVCAVGSAGVPARKKVGR